MLPDTSLTCADTLNHLHIESLSDSTCCLVCTQTVVRNEAGRERRGRGPNRQSDRWRGEKVMGGRPCDADASHQRAMQAAASISASVTKCIAEARWGSQGTVGGHILCDEKGGSAASRRSWEGVPRERSGLEVAYCWT